MLLPIQTGMKSPLKWRNQPGKKQRTFRLSKSFLTPVNALYFKYESITNKEIDKI